MVLFLLCLVALLLIRTIRADFARYSSPSDDILEVGDAMDDYGWKQVHGDVFRPPRHLVFLSAVMGTGLQLVILATLVILLIIVGDLYIE